jgi:Uma2 family endonuclease
MQPQPKPFLSPEAYLAIEREAETRSEYLAGEMFAMTGGSRQHNLIELALEEIYDKVGPG